VVRIFRRQIDAVAEGPRREFILRMTRHLRQFFPWHAGALDETQLHTLIEYGIERGAALGIVAERDVCKLVDLMVAFGPLFESDPRHPWAGRILMHAKGSDPSELVNALYDAALATLAQKARREAGLR
jgi:hypothetical protein